MRHKDAGVPNSQIAGMVGTSESTVRKVVQAARAEGGPRVPRQGKGKKDGSLHEITGLSLATQVLEALRDRNDLERYDSAMPLLDQTWNSPLLVWWGHEPPRADVERGAAALTEAHDAVRRRGARHGAAQRDALERFEDDLDVRARRPVSLRHR